jgi:DNA-binding transcriptional ArsR family regulator
MRAHKHVSLVGPQAPVDDKQLAVAAEVLAHLADPTRLHLLRLLILEQDVSTLTAQVAASRSSVSQHLGRLRLAGLVQARRDGRRMLYRITSDHLAALVGEALEYAEHAVQGIPHHQRHVAGLDDDVLTPRPIATRQSVQVDVDEERPECAEPGQEGEALRGRGPQGAEAEQQC